MTDEQCQGDSRQGCAGNGESTVARWTGTTPPCFAHSVEAGLETKVLPLQAKFAGQLDTIRAFS